MQEMLITVRIMLPMICMLAIGAILKRTGLMNHDTTQALNKMVFKLFLPALLFNKIRSINKSNLPGLSFAAFIFLGILCIFLLAKWLIPKFVPDHRKSGVMIQASFRTNFAILGLPLMASMFGDEGVALFSLAIPVVIPLNTVLAVIALSSTGGKTKFSDLLLKIIKNPLNIGMLLGLVMLFVPFETPEIIDTVAKNLAGLASPLSLLVLGASLQWDKIKGDKKELTVFLLIKQLILPLIMVSLAVLCGFRNMELGVLLILFGAPVAVSSYPMACAMGADGDLAGSCVVLTTLCSIGTLFILIFLGKLLCFI